MAISLEMISYNVKSDFFKDLILAVAKLREDLPKFDKKLKRGKEVEYGPIKDIIFKHTGILVKDYLVPNSYGISPAIVPPDLDRNNPILHPLKSNVFTNRQLKEQVKKSDSGILSGEIDYSKGTVGGDFSKVESLLIIPNMILTTKAFTNAEIASMLLHECGHVFSYFMYLSRTVTINHVLGQLTEEFNKVETSKEQIELIEETNKMLKVDTLDAEDLAKVKDGERVSTVIVSEVVKHRLSYTDTPVFDFRTWEAMSDQYASRNGASVDLASGLDKMYRMFDMPAYWSTGKYVMVNVFTAPFIVLSLPILLLATLISEPYDAYDKPKDRLKRIRREMVNALKNKSLSKGQSKTIQEDIDKVDGLLNEMSDRSDLVDVVWRLMNPALNRDRKQTAYLNELEIMANNDLYVRANRLKHS